MECDLSITLIAHWLQDNPKEKGGEPMAKVRFINSIDTRKKPDPDPCPEYTINNSGWVCQSWECNEVQFSPRDAKEE